MKKENYYEENYYEVYNLKNDTYKVYIDFICEAKSNLTSSTEKKAKIRDQKIDLILS